MKYKYIAVCDCNNGYTCLCCGREWEEIWIEEFNISETKEDAIKYFKDKEYPDEKTLNNIYKIDGGLL